MNWLDIIAFSIGGALILLMALGIALSSIAPSLSKWDRRYLITLFSFQLVEVVLCFLDALFYKDATMAGIERVIYVLGFVFLPPLLVMPTIFLLHRANENVRKSLLFKGVIGLSILYYILAIVAQFTDIFYTVTADNDFVRGDYFPLFLSPLVLIAVLNVIGTFVKRKKLIKRYFVSSMIYLPPLALTLVVHLFISSEFYVLLGVGLWALTILALVNQENMEEHMRQQREIANQRASILVLQMRPHFIYNTMTSIYYLCDQDPAKAKQVTLDFTTYLRKNFAALATDHSVPFTDELEHTRAYLAVEQAQFEDTLFVEFNTPHTLFHLPPLTLQPIVENAVKHGMSKSKDPIHIYVTTRKTDKGSLVIVEDDGPGLKPMQNDDPHIALNNIRQRLEMTCKGNLEIASREGGGTAVTIFIPNPKSSDAE